MFNGKHILLTGATGNYCSAFRLTLRYDKQGVIHAHGS